MATWEIISGHVFHTSMHANMYIFFEGYKSCKETIRNLQRGNYVAKLVKSKIEDAKMLAPLARHNKAAPGEH